MISSLASHLKRSRFLHILPKGDQSFVAYHSLFGNLSYLNDSSVKLLEGFNGSSTPQQREELSRRYPPYVQTFYDLYYLVEDGFDERGEVDRELSRREGSLASGKLIGGVQLTVSDACNFRCTYCFVDFVDRRGEARQRLSRARNKLMSFETARQTIDTLVDVARSHGREGLVVKFFGREPLTNWRLMQRILEHYGHGEGGGVRIHYALTTNGSLATPEIAETLGRFGVQTTVSVDGLAESNDKTRLSKAGGPTFDQILRGIENLHRSKAVQVFSGVLTEDNFDQFDQRFIDFARRYDVAEVQVLLGMQGDFIQRIDTDAVAAKLFDIYSYGKSRGVRVTGYWHNALVEVLTSHKLRGSEMVRGVIPSCTATGHQISVEPSGDIFPCKAMSTHMGHISDLAGTLGSKVYRHVIMRTYGNVPDCHDCPVEGFCQGICLGNLEQKFDDIYHVDTTYCDVYRRVFNKILASG